MSSSSNEYSDWIASTYHFVDRNGSVRVNVDEVVVLAAIQFTDDLVPNGRHLRVQHTYGKRDVSSFLIQQGKGEVGDEGSSSSTTAWLWWNCSTPAGLRRAQWRRRRCWRGRGR